MSLPSSRTIAAGPELLVGRTDELARLAGHLDRLGAGTGGVVEVVGAAGIGKTTMLQHVSVTAFQRGWRVLAGRATEFEREIPFGVLHHALGADAAGLDDPAAVGLARHRGHLAIRDRLEAIASAEPVVVMFDDIHWADPASADLLASLVHRPPAGPVLIVLAYRPNQADSTVSPGIARAFAAGLADRIELGPLAPADAERLIPTNLALHERRQIRDLCGGNPFYLRAMARARQGSVAPDPVPGAPRRAVDGVQDPQDLVPAAVSAALAGELAPLSPDARLFLRGAAITGEPFDVDVAAAVADLPFGDRVLTALDELVAADLIRPTDQPRTLAFRHPLVRHTVALDAGAGWRIAAHGRAAVALERTGARPSELAAHIEHSARHGDNHAIELLTRAGKEAAARAPASAARWFTSAWELVPEPRRGEWPHLDLYRCLVVALLVVGQSHEARERALEAHASLPDDHPFHPFLLIGCAIIESLAGLHVEARTRLFEAIDAAPAGAPERVRYQIELASLAAITGDPPEVREQSAEAMAGAEQLGDPLLRVEATAFAAIGAFLDGDLEAARIHLDSGSQQLSELDEMVFAVIQRAILGLIRAAWLLGRVDLAAQHVAKGLIAARGGSAPILAVQMVGSQALVLAAQGRLVEARRAADEATEEATLMANDDSIMWSQLALAVALEPVGDSELAVEAARVAVTQAQKALSLGMAAFAGQTCARALLANDQPGEVAEVIFSTHGGDGFPVVPESMRATSYALLATAAAQLKDLTAAGEWLEHAGLCSAVLPQGSSELAVALAESRVARASGDPERAVQASRRAIALAVEHGFPVEECRARLVLGAGLADLGDRSEAARELRAAEAACAEMGAARLQALAVRELRRIGRRVTREGRGGRRDLSGAAALTARQREIATLASTGLTNREIADQLFLSQSTVETHLAGAFAKLGVKTRDALASLLG